MQSENAQQDMELKWAHDPSSNMELKWVDDPSSKALFLSLPERLYAPEYRTQNTAELSQLIDGTQVLSKYFAFHALVLCRRGQCVARCALSIYPHTNVAYLGFFEAENNVEDVRSLFAEAERKAVEYGCERVVGPVNAGFWFSYRMKANRFDDRPYFSEAYNLPYYVELWQRCGYSVSDQYATMIYARPKRNYENEKYIDRLEEFRHKGYDIRSPRNSNFDTAIRDVWAMIMELYVDLPVFTPVSADDFVAHYDTLRHLLDFSMCKIAYFQGQAVGFFLGVPDHGNIVAADKLGLIQKLKILKQKLYSRRYVMLYMGVLPEHQGLGKAIAQTIIERARARRVDALGAFIHEGRPTEKYVLDLIEDRYIYLLFSKDIVNKDRCER